MAVEDFSEHVDHCNVNFKQAIMEKVKALKQTDETILTERVSVAMLPNCFFNICQSYLQVEELKG